jgi:hypothetical protein
VTRVIAVPPLVGIAVLVIYLGVESIRPGTLTAPRPQNIAEAIVVGNGPMALELMAGGADIDAAAPVRAGLMGDDAYDVTPIEAALLAGRPEIVRLLVRTGADPSRSRRVPCLARISAPELLPMLGLPPAAPDGREISACLAIAP